ncbi:MAG: DUF2207 domain-containing protein [Ruthenibacterium sp.]
MKKLLCLLLVFCGVLAFVPNASAAGFSGYTLTNYEVDAVLHENNTVTQTEYITADFLVPKHGIFRVFPEMVYVEKQTADGLKTMSYKVKLRDVSVQGGDAEVYLEDEMYTIRIGSEDTVLTGLQNYVISFTYDIGDDRIDDYDELFYAVNGSDWDAEIENFSFNFTFEKPLSAKSVQDFQLFSGTYGSIGNVGDIAYEVTENGVSGHSTHTLAPYTAVSLYTRMDEGYFTNERSVSTLPALIVFGVLAVAALFVLFKALMAHRQKPVQTVEFYPPNDIPSAEVGYFIDGTADDKDLLSLIIWFAGKGYLEIHGNEKAMSLTRLKPLNADAPAYLKTIFQALFSNGETCDLQNLNEKFYEKLTRAKTELGEQFTGDRALYKPNGHVLSVLLPLLCIALWGVGTVLSGCFIDSGVMFFTIISAVLLFLITVLALCADGRRTFSTGAGKFGWSILLAVLSVVSLFFAVLASEYVLIPMWIPLVTFLPTLACCLLAPRFVQDTPYRVETAGKLLGLRNFIEQAELPRLQMLVNENPSYFYDVLPYAYVFGLSDKWAKQFESLALPPPGWYYGNNLDVFDILWFNSMMNHSFNSSLTHLHTVTSTSGGHGGASFGGGGGFSGGGFGGGGGGSW